MLTELGTLQHKSIAAAKVPESGRDLYLALDPTPRLGETESAYRSVACPRGPDLGSAAMASAIESLTKDECMGVGMDVGVSTGDGRASTGNGRVS